MNQFHPLRYLRNRAALNERISLLHRAAARAARRGDGQYVAQVQQRVQAVLNAGHTGRRLDRELARVVVVCGL